MSEAAAKLLISAIALKWHLSNLERRAFGFACLSAFLLGALLVENISLAYFCYEKADQSAENSADYGGDYSRPSGNLNKASLKDKSGKSGDGSSAVGKHGDFIIGEPLDVLNDSAVLGNIKPIYELLNFNIHISKKELAHCGKSRAETEVA